MKCDYGCNQEAKFKMSSGKNCCSDTWRKCPEVSRKNSKGVKKSYLNGRITSADYSLESRYKMGSPNRGKNISNCEHIKRKSETTKRNYKNGTIISSWIGRKHSEKTKRKLREWMLDYLEDETGEIITPSKGKHETECFDELEKVFGILIKRNPKIIGYFPDGYIIDMNIIIEFDEPFHDNPIHKKKDEIRQTNIVDFLHCKFYRIKESDWLNDKKDVISEIRKLISN